MHKVEMRMYADNILSENGVTVKICDKVPLKAEIGGGDPGLFLEGTGYERGREYHTKGTCYAFILNEFADLLEKIPLDRRHIMFKAKLHIFNVN